ncbi:nitroreductase family protein [Actomonas aquatica]|uniref:Nitroreductase family protein n=1 Tax=Actomonas aquatica TaxID=2866162 RepID=A0ABZ1CHG4_9BACT|nr:nitroreductase family protein [Opitutus sp. WL0086]WRQ90024.1 nitroreductase family protein [Opitutus sp. WL0086]
MDSKTSMEPLAWERRSDAAMVTVAQATYERLRTRRTVREFSADPVPRAVIEACIQTAGTAPSGANLQPWHFVAVNDVTVKRRIREAAEAEEREFYERRASAEWKRTLAPLGTNAEKPFLETAPWLIAIFAVNAFEDPATGERRQTYYPKESVGIATGMLIAALHEAGLATLTHTPSPMGFLNEILQRPATEKPFLLLVVGHPAEGARVPSIGKKTIGQIVTWR